MAKAIFHRDFEFRRPRKNFAKSVKAHPEPQTLPKDVVDAAVAAGAAEIVEPKRKRKAD